MNQTKGDLRWLPIAVGMVGGTMLLVNRWQTLDLTPSQARSDVVGVILCGFLLLIGLLWRQIQPVPPEMVILEGEEGFDLASSLADPLRTELAWASHLLLTNTVTGSLVLYHRGDTLLRRGVWGPESRVVPGAILQRVLSTQKPVYLVDLRMYPGRVEFNYLPPNTQGIICQPLGPETALILGARAARSYTKQDERWIAGIADKLALALLSEPSPPP